MFVLQVKKIIWNDFDFPFVMENQIELNKNSKNVFECQSLTLNFNENVKKNPSQQIDDVDNKIYKNTIKFSTALPQVKKNDYTNVYAFVHDCECHRY